MTLLPVWFKGLTPELQRKAEVELGETQIVKERALKELRSLINDQDDIHIRQDDLFLLRFLRPTKYDVQKSFKVIHNYYNMLAKHRGTLSGKKPSEMKHIYGMNHMCFAPYRITPGSHVCIMRIGSFDLEKASAKDIIAFNMMLGELAMECEATQICGGIYIVDFLGITFQHYFHFLSIPFASLVLSLFQDCWAERINSIHFVNEPFLLHAVVHFLRSMIRKKFRKRIHFHGSDLSRLHVHIPKDLLPEELGGSLGPYDNKECVDYLLSQEVFFERANKYGVIEKDTSKY